ncbi:hypothetical protein CRYUN_Cryun32bG0086700 [Craigia yunnanensis]
MEMLNVFFCALIDGSVLAVLVRAQGQSGFISIDCGISAASTYNDATTGIKYISDATFIDSGVSKSISPLNSSLATLISNFIVSGVSLKEQETVTP